MNKIIFAKTTGESNTWIDPWTLKSKLNPNGTQATTEMLAKRFINVERKLWWRMKYRMLRLRIKKFIDIVKSVKQNLTNYKFNEPLPLNKQGE